jgi:hypothetical protein
MFNSPEELVGKIVGAVLFRTDSDETAFASGTVVRLENEYVIQGDGVTLPLPGTLKDRVRKNDDPSAFDGVEYIVFLSVAPIPKDTDTTDLRRTGGKWPQREDGQ